MSQYKDIKEQSFEANMQLPELGLVLYTFGNVSAVDREKGVFAIKPSGVDYDDLKVDDIVVVDFQNNVLEGTMRPSSDTKTHAHLYRAFPEIGGIVHTHSTHAVAWAQAVRDVPIYGTTHADHLATDVPCTAIMRDDQIEGDYEEETGVQIVEAFEGLNPNEVEMVLVACHGPFTWGKTAAKAVYNSAVLEEVARMAMMTESINPDVARLRDAIKNKHYNRKHGANAYYGQES